MSPLLRRTLLLVAGSAALATLGLPAATAAPARPTQALPPITVSTTALAVGTELTVTGTGCVDPNSGFGTGYSVGVGLTPRGQPDDFTYGSLDNPPFFAVEANGTWEFSTTIDQPLPPVPADLVVRCFPSNSFGAYKLYEPVPVTITLPPISGVQVEGERITFDRPCAPLGAVYLFEDDRLVATLTDVSVPANSVIGTVPSTVPSGTYRLVAACFGARQAPSGAFGATIDYVAAQGEPAPMAPAPAPPAAAAPIQGSPSFTG